LKTVIIVGGGLSGLVTGARLANAGIACTVIERKVYPFHRVCGEYCSMETVPFLKSCGLFPEEFSPPLINQFQLTSVNGKSAVVPLDLGGFGLSRYAFDNFLYQKALQAGVSFRLGIDAEKIHRHTDHFEVKTTTGSLAADVVIGAFGKRSKLDVALDRTFIKKRSPYIGVKYHLRTPHPPNLIALHNFKDGYCGVSNIEDGKTNLCYLSHRNNLKKYGDIPKMEEAVLFRNPFLKKIFEHAEFLFDRPETINEISFETKGPVDHHVLMTGDAAGMITPLCGNGMAMAIHSAKLLSDLLIQFCKDANVSPQDLERRYSIAWKDLFRNRLWRGRQIQKLFGSERASNAAVNLLRHSGPIAAALVKSTHGVPF
jgi:flavin-dependent dehydrogenase